MDFNGERFDITSAMNDYVRIKGKYKNKVEERNQFDAIVEVS